jgi:DNA-binding transcriptional ArsR family regulator
MINNDTYIKFFKALANEERIEIIKLLKKNGEMFAQDIERHFYLEQSTTSHHLNMLKKAGITQSRKEGRKVFYSINTDSIKLILDSFDTVIF